MTFGDNTKPFNVTKAFGGGRGMLGGRLSDNQKPSFPINHRKLIQMRNQTFRLRSRDGMIKCDSKKIRRIQ
jgi:hypothetical protein